MRVESDNVNKKMTDMIFSKKYVSNAPYMLSCYHAKCYDFNCSQYENFKNIKPSLMP